MEGAGKTIIKVVGVGGAGGSGVRRMIESGLNKIDYAVINTDQTALNNNPADIKIAIGRKLTKGLGAGMDSAIGRESAIEDIDEIRSYLEGCHMVFIVSGMGGGTGTGAAPVVAEVAKELDILTVAIVSTPFNFEGSLRTKLANTGIKELKKHTDTLLIIPNQKLLQISGDITPSKAFDLADDILRDSIKGITNLINGEGEINLDFMDVKKVMKDKGKAYIGVGVAKGNNRGTESAIKAMESPVINSNTFKNAQGIIVYMEIDPEFTLHNVESTVDYIGSRAGDNAPLIFGYKLNHSFKGEIHTTVIVTGFEVAKEPANTNSHKEENHNLEKKTKELEPIILDNSFSISKIVDKPHIPKDYEDLNGKDFNSNTPAFLRKQAFDRYNNE